MPRPIDPVKRVYYADDLTVWASGVNIPDLEVSINNYLEEITAYLKNNSLLISASKFSVNYSPQILTRPRPILVYSSRSHACRWLNALIIQQAHPLCSRESIKQEQHPYSISRYILVHSRRKHYRWLTNRSEDRSSTTLHMFGVQTYTTPITYTLQYTQNEALTIATGCHKISIIDHLHTKAEMLKVRENSDLLSAQYLDRRLEPENVCHSITTRATLKKQMKETLYTSHRNTVEPRMVEKRIATLQVLHTYTVNKALSHERKT